MTNQQLQRDLEDLTRVHARTEAALDEIRLRDAVYARSFVEKAPKVATGGRSWGFVWLPSLWASSQGP